MSENQFNKGSVGAIEKMIILRERVLKMIETLTEEQVFKIPAGFNNNIAWNIGHLCASQQALHYKLSNLPSALSEEYIALFRKGSSPKEWTAQPSWPEIKSNFIQLALQLKKDYDAGLFVSYNPYTTSMGVTLNNISDAVEFVLFHEGTHAGIVLSLKKMVM